MRNTGNRLALVLVAILALSFFICAFIPAPYQSARATVGQNTQDYVDSSGASHDTNYGTHSSFAAQQAGPDAVSDTLTEANVPGSESIYGNTGTSTNYDLTGVNWYYGYVFTSPADIGQITDAHAYIRTDTGSGNAKFVIVLHSNLNIITNGISGAVGVSTTVQWKTFTFTTAPTLSPSTDYVLGIVTDVSIRIYTTTGNIANEGHYDTTNSYASPINPTDAAHLTEPPGAVYCHYNPLNYRLDLEEKWSSADYDEANEYLCVYPTSIAAENLKVDVWTGAAYTNVIAALVVNQWNNASVHTYLTGTTFEMRFIDATTTSDPTQSAWAIDAVLLHTWTTSPVNTACSCTNLDDTNKLYAAYKAYTFSCTVTDADGYADLYYINMTCNSASPYWKVSYLEASNAFSEYSDASNYITLNTGSCTYSKSGTSCTAVFNININWNHPDSSSVNLQLDSKTDTGMTDSDTYAVGYTYETRLDFSSGPTLNDGSGTATRGNIGGSITASGTVIYYGGTVHPPAAQVDVWIACSGATGSPWEATNYADAGTFSKTVTAHGTVGSHNYGFTVVQQGAGSGGTDECHATHTVGYISDRVTVTLTLTYTKIGVNQNCSGLIKGAIYAYDSSAFDGTVTLNSTTFSYASGCTHGFTATAVSGGAHGVTSFTTNSLTVIWETVSPHTFSYIWLKYSEFVWYAYLTETGMNLSIENVAVPGGTVTYYRNGTAFNSRTVTYAATGSYCDEVSQQFSYGWGHVQWKLYLSYVFAPYNFTALNYYTSSVIVVPVSHTLELTLWDLREDDYNFYIGYTTNWANSTITAWIGTPPYYSYLILVSPAYRAESATLSFSKLGFYDSDVHFIDWLINGTSSGAAGTYLWVNRTFQYNWHYSVGFDFYNSWHYARFSFESNYQFDWDIYGEFSNATYFLVDSGTYEGGSYIYWFPVPYSATTTMSLRYSIHLLATVMGSGVTYFYDVKSGITGDLYIFYYDQHGNNIPFDTFRVYLNGTQVFQNYATWSTGAAVNVTTVDRFGTTINVTVCSYTEVIEIQLTMYSLKVVSFYNGFIWFNVTKSGTSEYWSKYLAPLEISNYELYSGSYALYVDYLNGTINSVGFSLPSGTHGDYAFIITESTVHDILYFWSQTYQTATQINITVVTTQNDIITLNISLLNVNSTIQSQIINVLTNIQNSNSTIFAQTVSLLSQLSNVNSTLYAQTITLIADIQNVNSTLYSQIVSVLADVINTNSTLYGQTLVILNYLNQINATLYSGAGGFAAILLRGPDVQDKIYLSLLTNWGNATIYFYSDNVYSGYAPEGMNVEFTKNTSSGVHAIAFYVEGSPTSYFWINSSYTVGTSTVFMVYLHWFTTGQPGVGDFCQVYMTSTFDAVYTAYQNNTVVDSGTLYSVGTMSSWQRNDTRGVFFIGIKCVYGSTTRWINMTYKNAATKDWAYIAIIDGTGKPYTSWGAFAVYINSTRIYYEGRYYLDTSKVYYVRVYHEFYNQLLGLTVTGWADEITVTVTTYSFKFQNRYDYPVWVCLKHSGLSWSEYAMTDEVANFIVMSGQYDLYYNKTGKVGTMWVTEQYSYDLLAISVTQDKAFILLGMTLYDITNRMNLLEQSSANVAAAIGYDLVMQQQQQTFSLILAVVVIIGAFLLVMGYVSSRFKEVEAPSEVPIVVTGRKTEKPKPKKKSAWDKANDAWEDEKKKARAEEEERRTGRYVRRR
jgi:hypothetical protein